jgi:putative spermidine/putrescine transport system permease protein
MSPSGHRTPWGRLGHGLYLALCALVLAFLVLPILAIIPLSFSAGSFLSYPLPGLSWRWYADFFSSQAWLKALRNSLIIGAATTVLATGLGTLASVGLLRASFRGKALIMGVLISPLFVPVIIVAVGVYLFYARVGLASTYTGLILAHTVLASPFVVITVSAALQGFDMNLLRAAASLGASPARAFFQVMLPLIAPGVASGALFAFATSFDELVVVLFVAGPEHRTLPRQMFDGLRENVSPTIMAVATLLTLLSVVLLGTLDYLRRRSARLQRTGG